VEKASNQVAELASPPEGAVAALLLMVQPVGPAVLSMTRAPELLVARDPAVGGVFSGVIGAACDVGVDAVSKVQLATVAETGDETGETGLGEGGAEKV
jgi:hypothetical protein